MAQNRWFQMTAEHLGPDATDEDVVQFVEWAQELARRDGLTAGAAINRLWNDGDYLAAAERLGLSNV